jgi:hypothetical protein
MTKAPTQIPACPVAIKRGLDFIYRFGSISDNFEQYGSFLICCFALLGATASDQKLRELGRAQCQKLARRWLRNHRIVSTDVTPDLLLDFILTRYALSRVGVKDRSLTAQLRLAAKKFSAMELISFDPLNEPPPEDVPFPCECGLKNPRGRKYCKKCRRRLQIQGPNRVWMEALANTYVAERCGIQFGARYSDVLSWLPKMRPYPVGADANDESFREAIYAATHVVYTLNDYGRYQLSPRWLPQEFAFLKASVAPLCLSGDVELLGELLDSLKAFGLPASHPLIRRGTNYLLATQNSDGSWGDPDEDDVATRCHTTWTAIDGLRECAWRGTRLSFPEARSLLRSRA